MVIENLAKRVNEYLNTRDLSRVRENVIYQFNVHTVAKDESMSLMINSDGTAMVLPYAKDEHDAFVNTTEDVINQILEHKTNFEEAYLSGKLNVGKSVGKALLLKSII